MNRVFQLRISILLGLILANFVPALSLAAMDSAEEQALVQSLKEREDDSAFILKSAEQLGQNGSMEGLKKFIDLLKVEAVDVFYKHYTQLNTPLPEEIQPIIISNFNNDIFREHLAQFVYKRPYDNRDLFDLIHGYAHKKEKVNGTGMWYELMLVTRTRGIEGKVLQIYKYLDETGRKDILEFMIRRKYEDAIPYFISYHDEAGLGPKSLYVHSSLLKYQSAAGAAALGELFTRYKVPKPGQLHLDLTTSALIHLEQFPESVPIDFSKFISEIPFKNYDKVITRFISLIQKRHPPEAVRFMLAYLHNPKYYKLAFNALESYVDLQAWQDTKAELGKAYNGKIFDTRYYQAAVAKLDDNIARYDQLVRARDRKKGPTEMDSQLATLQQQYKLHTLKNANADTYLELYEDYIQGLEKFYKENRKHGEQRKIFLELIKAYKKVGNIQRFLKREPKKALAWYDKIIEANEDGNFTESYEALLMRAETLQYDLQQVEEATETYIKALDEMRRSEELARYAALKGWLDDWLVKHVRFLKTGKRFKGTVDRRDVAAFSVALIFANRILDINGIQRSLSEGANLSVWQMPKSHFLFSRYIMSSRNETPEKLLAKLDQVDQSGYWQKNYFSFVTMAALPKENRLAQNMRKMGNSVTIRKAITQYQQRNH